MRSMLKWVPVTGQLSYFSWFLVLKVLFNLCVVCMFTFTGVLGAGKRALEEENGTFIYFNEQAERITR